MLNDGKNVRPEALIPSLSPISYILTYFYLKTPEVEHTQQ